MSRAAPPRATLNDVLKQSAWIWPFTVALFGGGALWAMPDHLGGGGAVRHFGTQLFFAGIGAGLLWYACSKVLRAPRRVIVHVLFLWVLAIPPLVTTIGFLAAGYFVLIPQPPLARVFQFVTIGFAGAVWIGIELQGLRERVVAKRYMEREFIEFDDHVELRWERKTSIEPSPISDRTFMGRIWNRQGWKIFAAIAPLSGAGYAMSRLLDRAGGDEAVLLILAMLMVPVCVYMISKMLCAAYLDLYKVWQVERRTGKPVLFDHIPAE